MVQLGRAATPQSCFDAHGKFAHHSSRAVNRHPNSRYTNFSSKESTNTGPKGKKTNFFFFLVKSVRSELDLVRSEVPSLNVARFLAVPLTPMASGKINNQSPGCLLEK